MIGTLLLILAIAALLLAVGPALLFATNWRQYLPPPEPDGSAPPAVSLLIPARNEEAGIADCVRSALAGRGVDVEVIVLDDQSTDGTADRVRELAATEPRVRLESAPPLPPGWCGKQHACWALASLATHPVLTFIDADVRLEPDGLRRSAQFLQGSAAGLVSGVPRQITETFLERLLLPLIHFVLLGYLPLQQMRASKQPALGAGCGQFFMTTRTAYDAAGGHAAIRASLHDGITLPRAYRRAGIKTDLFDATPVARCRMYRTGHEVVRGLAKNATEGMANATAIGPWTALLLGGQVLPMALLMTAFRHPVIEIMAAVSLLASYAVRLASARRFHQPVGAALLHPVGILFLVAIQWYALIRHLAGRPPAWRGRTYAPVPSPSGRGLG